MTVAERDREPSLKPADRAASAASVAPSGRGIVIGVAVGAAVGLALAGIIHRDLLGVGSGAWIALLVLAGLVIGGAVGGILGTIFGIPGEGAQPNETVEAQLGTDRLTRVVLPFVIPPAVILVIATLVVSFGSTLLSFGKSTLEINGVEISYTVWVALLGVVLIGVLGTILANAQSGSSDGDTASHAGH